MEDIRALENKTKEELDSVRETFFEKIIQRICQNVFDFYNISNLYNIIHSISNNNPFSYFSKDRAKG